MTVVKIKSNFTIKQQAYIELSERQSILLDAGVDALDNLCETLERRGCTNLAAYREQQFREGNVTYRSEQEVLEFIFGKSITEVTPDIKGTDN